MYVTKLAYHAAFFCFFVGSDSAKKVEVKETLLDSAVADMQWFGPKQKTVLVQTKKGRLYRTENGKDWVDITDKLQDRAMPIVVDRIIKSPADPNTMMVVGTKKIHFLSQDAGKTWRRIRQKATIHTFMFHNKRSRWALLSTWTDKCEVKSYGRAKDEDDDDKKKDDMGPCKHLLYVTKDMGRTFSLVASYVVQFSWGDASHDQQDRIYFSHFRKKSGDQHKLSGWSDNVDFAYTDNMGQSVRKLVHHGNKFLVSNGFIMVVKLKSKESQTVNLKISSDGGGDFKEAKLPEEIDEKSYTVLDTSEGIIMLHVNHGAKEGGGDVGTVYISDKSGIRFALSLANNVRGSNGDCEFDKIQNLEGIYLANYRESKAESVGAEVAQGKKAADAEDADELEKESTGTSVEKRHTAKAKSKDETVVRTVISFDKGGAWSYLKPPKVDSLGKKYDCASDRCWLHLHGITNFQNYAPFYSTEQAVGLIMATGNVGPHLRFEADQTNTFLSRDGGLTWMEAHKGAFIYEFGDHGGLVIMADDVRKTKQVVFSWNEGVSWYDFEVSEYTLEVDNIVTEPNATSTKFVMYGTRGESGVLYHLDFEALGQPLCKGVWAADSVSSDYETWSPADPKGSEKCMMGKQVTFTRRKPTSECFNGEEFERPVNRKNCACTESDYECEIGFARSVGSMECKYTDDGSVPAPDRCKSLEEFKATAYRKVTGDTCEGGWRPEKVTVPCPRSAKFGKGAASVLGSMLMVGTMIGTVWFLSNSEKFREWFTNSGFNNYSNVKYAAIGALSPETGLDSVGTMEDDGQENFSRDAPKPNRYGSTTGANAPRRDPEPRSTQMEPVRRPIDTAANNVPKLQKPPTAMGGTSGGAAESKEDDGLDLL
mmetsp:Transcript_124552/g.248482  ORF Transcript_124552/g.248482 Transcript_124552/m.248482 type:complete len:879 (+) Transcript_124552:80-2716(+)